MKHFCVSCFEFCLCTHITLHPNLCLGWFLSNMSPPDISKEGGKKPWSSLHGLPWISAKPHSVSVIYNTIKPNPACPSGKERGKWSKKNKSGRQQRNGMINAVGARSVWQVHKLFRGAAPCSLPFASRDFVGKIKISSVCLRQIWRSSSLSCSSDHMRGVTHWWSLFPQLEKRCPTKRSDVF